ncbi:guanylate kinase [Holospora obtusa F1]|uniref:Guanylate kinase n=1 Tax=Holospora obtusa F1 TaxID=1399147 RepID=W6TED7_HOLOB|nr:AAA family ATPase [Holospora obtusa]ETZ07069.1 guanylate kinase [Holospora obtusa F1]
MKNIIIFCLAGLTGSGKTSISEAVAKIGNIETLIKVTTRPKRSSDLDKEYRFLSSEEYNKLLRENKFALHTEYYSSHYAVPYSSFEYGKKKNSFTFITPWNFCNTSFFDPKLSYVKIWLDISQEERIKRLLKRGDSEEYINRRLDIEKSTQFSNFFFQQRRQCQVVLDNSDAFEEVVKKMHSMTIQ